MIINSNLTALLFTIFFIVLRYFTWPWGFLDIWYQTDVFARWKLLWILLIWVEMFHLHTRDIWYEQIEDQSLMFDLFQISNYLRGATFCNSLNAKLYWQSLHRITLFKNILLAMGWVINFYQGSSVASNCNLCFNKILY